MVRPSNGAFEVPIWNPQTISISRRVHFEFTYLECTKLTLILLISHRILWVGLKKRRTSSEHIDSVVVHIEAAFCRLAFNCKNPCHHINYFDNFEPTNKHSNESTLRRAKHVSSPLCRHICDRYIVPSKTLKPHMRRCALRSPCHPLDLAGQEQLSQIELETCVFH